MTDDVKGAPERRNYHAPRRADRAAATRAGILTSARGLFASNGYPTTTVAQIATAAGVSVDTVYTAVGRKPTILRELVETAISGTARAVPAEQRDYVTRIREAGTAREKLSLYADAITAIQQRMAPVFLALRDAAVTDADCAELWAEISARRAINMHTFAGDLRATGDLRDDLTDDQVADIIWTMNTAEYWDLLVHQRHWTPDHFRDWLTDAWTRLLLT